LIFEFSLWREAMFFQFLVLRSGAKLYFSDFLSFALARRLYFLFFTVSRQSEALFF